MPAGDELAERLAGLRARVQAQRAALRDTNRASKEARAQASAASDEVHALLLSVRLGMAVQPPIPPFARLDRGDANE